MLALMIARILFLFSFFLLTACNDTYSWRQKLTVVVQTPDGEVSGSSVTEVTITHSDGRWVLPEARGARSKISGEAVVLEMTQGRYLFVLLDDVDQLALRTFDQFTYRRSDELKQWAQSIERHRGSGEVPREFYPMMVTFDDIDDPKSVQSVDPDNLSAAFGAGYDLMRMNLEITDDAVTLGNLETVLGWWLNLRSGPVDSMSPLQLPNDSPRGWKNLSALNFWSLDLIKDLDQIDSL